MEEKNQEIRERERAQQEQERLAEAEKAEAANQEEGEVRPRSTASRVREAMRAADKAEASMIAITHMTHHFHSLRKASVMHTGPLDLPDGEEDGAGPGEERGADVQAEDGGDASSEASEKEQAAAANVVEERPRTPPKVMMPARYRAQKKAEEEENSETVVEDSFATFLQRIETAFNDCRLQTVQEEFDDAPMARILQARLERIWRLLEMPVMDRLDMVTKYTDREASVVMVQALDCWEHCTGICLSHERLIELMQDMPRKGTEEQITNQNKLLSDSTHRVVDGLATRKRLFADTPLPACLQNDERVRQRRLEGLEAQERVLYARMVEGGGLASSINFLFTAPTRRTLCRSAERRARPAAAAGGVGAAG